ncbi:hypothetical protein [Thauera sp.]|uniref:hypothetical protein n=1 Tax=Thauera sp. TaxID=1905334 RepID=UPI002627AC02|nr:hypothetical protein [Thauera sp.]
MAEHIYPLLLIFMLIAGVAVTWNVDNWRCAGAGKEIRERWWIVPALIAMGLLLVFAGNTEFHELLGLMIVFVSVLSFLGLAVCAAVGSGCVPGYDLISVFSAGFEAASAEPRAPTDPPRTAGRAGRGTPTLVRRV